MNYEDSRNALFSEPNAYILNHPKKENSKKIVFSEPYENVPNYYVNNNFKKGENRQEHHHCSCEHNDTNHAPTNLNNKPNKANFFGGFNLQSLAPILPIFNGGSMDISKMASMFNSNNNSNPISMISSLLANNGGLANILNIFKGDLFTKNSKSKKEIKSTDYEISSYTRVN